MSQGKLNHTYLLYTRKEGVFYVGIGNDRRLKETMKPRKTHYDRTLSTKYQEIARREADGQEILLEVVFSSERRADVEQCERWLIACYGPALTNYIYKDTDNAPGWLPIGMKHQKFPLPDCPDCQRLWQEQAEAGRKVFKYYFWGQPGQFTPEQKDYQVKAEAYYQHTHTHPQIIPK